MITTVVNMNVFQERDFLFCFWVDVLCTVQVSLSSIDGHAHADLWQIFYIFSMIIVIMPRRTRKPGKKT